MPCAGAPHRATSPPRSRDAHRCPARGRFQANPSTVRSRTLEASPFRSLLRRPERLQPRRGSSLWLSQAVCGGSRPAVPPSPPNRGPTSRARGPCDPRTRHHPRPLSAHGQRHERAVRLCRIAGLRGSAMDAADEVWNRAAMSSGGPAPRQGDASLASVLGVHNLAMSGGLLNAVEEATPAQLDAAEAGYRWLQLDAAADVIGMVRREIETG